MSEKDCVRAWRAAEDARGRATRALLQAVDEIEELHHVDWHGAPISFPEARRLVYVGYVRYCDAVCVLEANGTVAYDGQLGLGAAVDVGELSALRSALTGADLVVGADGDAERLLLSAAGVWPSAGACARGVASSAAVVLARDGLVGSYDRVDLCLVAERAGMACEVHDGSARGEAVLVRALHRWLRDREDR